MKTSMPLIGWLILVVTGCLFSMSGCVRRSVYPVLPIVFDRNELVDTWIGFNDDDATRYTLILQRTSDGVLYSQFEGGTVTTNMISRWEIQGSMLRCKFQHEDSPTRVALLECSVKKALLVGSMIGVGGWEEQIQFRRILFLEDGLKNAKMFEPNPHTVPQKP